MDLLPPLLKPRDACRILGVCRNTLRRMIEAGQVEAIDIRQPGGRYSIWRIRRDSLRDPTDPAERLAQAEIENSLKW